MASGTIKQVNERGFGFLTPEGKTTDLFFHASSMQRRSDFDELQVGDKVTYEEGKGPDDRPRAVNVAVSR